jgi:Ca2+-transporting ATPase
MTVVQVHASNDPLQIRTRVRLLESLMILNHDAQETNHGEWLGDATEIALVEYAQKKYGNETLNKVRQHFPRLAELPFDAERKKMTTLHAYGNRFIVVVKGAVEAIAGGLQNTAEAKHLLEKTDKMALEGMRVLAYAYKIVDEWPNEPHAAEIEAKLLYAGLVGIIDPPREEVKKQYSSAERRGFIP